MIAEEIITVRGKEYTRTYSDEGYYIQAADGALYTEAVDPVGSSRSYTETAELAEGEELTDSEALQIITGGVTANDTN